MANWYTEDASFASTSGADINGTVANIIIKPNPNTEVYLDKSNFKDVCILSYAAKFASNFYGPFRNAIGSNISLKSDKKT